MTFTNIYGVRKKSSLIPGLGKSTGEGIGYLLQYSWASLVAQLVKNPLAMWETWLRSLGGEDLLKKGKATLSSILAWRIPRTIKSMGSKRLSLFTFKWEGSLWESGHMNMYDCLSLST